ncbi:MAG: ribosome maturation factor RimM [Gemmatimonadota bacterium]|jgi:16S rRNA processing protein RimM
MTRVPEPEFLVVGHLSKAHGVRGDLLIQPLTDRPEEVFAVGRRVIIGDERGQVGESPLERRVEEGRPYKRGWMAHLEGVADRSTAEELAGRYLLVPAAERGRPADGEFFYHQLLGLRVETVSGEVVGTVREVYETEPRHLLEVKGGAGIHLVPFDRRIIRSIELESGRVVIDPPAGLLEL